MAETISVREVAKELGVSEESVRTMIHCGVINGGYAFKKKYSKRYTYLVLRKEFESWIGKSTKQHK